MDEKADNGNPKECHMWVVRSGKHEAKQLVIFNYRASRGGDVATDVLSGYDRYFVSDGYSEYNDGASAAANAYSLVETAKANDLDVLKYLNFVFRCLHMADGILTDEFLESLMPWNDTVKADCKRGYI